MSAPTAAQLLAEKFPPLARYCPNLWTVSAPQAAFLFLDQREAFYGGAAGGGKSDALLMAALQHVDQPGYAALILRRTYPELEGSEGLIARANAWLTPTDARWNEQKKRWTFPSGAVLQFGHVKTENDKYRYQGQSYQFVGFDELTHFTESIYDYIAFTRSRRLRSMEQAGVPIRARGASNPGNIGHGWVKRRFITHRKPVVVFVPAKLADNPGLDTESYVESLSSIPDELRKQLLDGDWDAFQNQAFPDFGPLHLVDEFPLASSNDRIEGMDYGLNGTAWYLVPSDYDGNIVFHDSIVEANLLPDEIAPLVIAKRKQGWGFGHPAYADPSIWHRTGTRNKFGQPSILADEFGDAGVPVARANEDPRAGLIRLRTLMKADPGRRFPDWHPRRGELGSPRLFVVGKRCPELVEQWSAAPLQPIDKADGGEKIDPEWESRYGHSCAASRYVAMARLAPSVEPQQEDPDPRRQALLELNARDQERAASTGRFTNV